MVSTTRDQLSLVLSASSLSSITPAPCTTPSIGAWRVPTSAIRFARAHSSSTSTTWYSAVAPRARKSSRLARISRTASTAAVLRWISAGVSFSAPPRTWAMKCWRTCSAPMQATRPAGFVEQRRAAGEDQHVARPRQLAQRLGGDAARAAGGEDDEAVEVGTRRRRFRRRDGAEHGPRPARVAHFLAAADELELGQDLGGEPRRSGRGLDIDRLDAQRRPLLAQRLEQADGAALHAEAATGPRVAAEAAAERAEGHHMRVVDEPAPRRRAAGGRATSRGGRAAARHVASGASAASHDDPAAARWTTPAIAPSAGAGPARSRRRACLRRPAHRRRSGSRCSLDPSAARRPRSPGRACPR